MAAIAITERTTLGRGASTLRWAVVLLGLLAFRPAMAGPLDVAPDSVTIESGASAIVVIKSDDKGALPALLIVDPPGVHSKIVRTPDAQTPAKTRSWLVQVTIDPALAIDGDVTFQLQRDNQIFATGQVKVTPKAAPTVATSVQAELLFDGETLLDGRDGVAFLQLTNLTDDALTVSPPRPIAPPEIAVNPALKEPVTLPARGVYLMQLAISVARDQTVISGKHVIGLIVPVARAGGDLPWRGEIAVSKEITVGVPGMSELQSVLQIPSLLLLPGLLVVISFVAVRGLVKPPTAGDALSRFAFAWSPWLWIAAITFSGVIVFAYPYLTSWILHLRRDILYGYSMTDLVAVWIGSIAVGGIPAAILDVIDHLAAQRKAARLFSANEQPLPFLARLALRGVGYRFPFIQNAGKSLYRLDPTEVDGMVWAAPALLYTPTDAGFDARGIDYAVRANDIEALSALLRKEAGEGSITLAWGGYGALSGPALVPSATFAKLDPTHSTSIIELGS